MMPDSTDSADSGVVMDTSKPLDDVKDQSDKSIESNDIIDADAANTSPAKEEDRVSNLSPVAPDALLNDLKKSELRDKVEGDITEDRDNVEHESGDDGGDEDNDESISSGESVHSWDSYRRKYEQIEDRIRLAPKRRRQHNQYVNILEDRLCMLEKRCDLYDKERQRKIEKVEPVEEPPTVILPQKKPQLEMALNFQFWKEFMEYEGKPHMIDVLVGEPETGKPARKPRRRTAISRFGNQFALMDMEDLLDEVDDEKRYEDNERDLKKEINEMRGNYLPERIRINSFALRYVFSKVLSIASPEDSIDRIVLRPYKGFLQNEREMRLMMADLIQALSKLEAKKEEAKFKPEKREEAPPQRDTTTEEEKADTEQTDGEKSTHTEATLPSTNEPDAITHDEWTSILEELDSYHCNACIELLLEDWPTISLARQGLRTFEGFIDDFIKPVNTEIRRRTAQKIRFRDLWHLFYTEDLIVVSRNPKNEDDEIIGKVALRVLRTSGGRRVVTTSTEPQPFDPTSPIPAEKRITPVNGVNPFCIHGYYLDFDGSKLVPVRRRFVIPPFPGERKITDLDILPIEYAHEVGIMDKEAFQNRGRNFVSFVMSDSVTYLDCAGSELRTKEELNDKVIVDMKEYFKDKEHRKDIPVFTEPEGLDVSETNDCFRGADCSGGTDCWHKTTSIIPDQPIDKAILKEYRNSRAEFKVLFTTVDPDFKALPDYSICHYRVFAYKMRSREWVQVDVDNLQRPKATEVSMGFKQLVLDPDHKRILQSQVREHFRKRGVQGQNVAAEDDMDLVRGKGQGLIILLHGAPGVGKTCTAECIADLVKKPLYPITCGDLGSTAEDVERNLQKHFKLASRWDCVMLLDEADVFLAKRKQEDLHRNSIVSVFLRMLEYYKGLLFLTTNRVGTFDEAFKSRVHISLFYPNFDKDTTFKVWQTFIEQTKNALERNNRKNVTLREDEILDFAKKHWKKNPKGRWNGRQIRNAFHTAVAMAEFDARDGKSGDGTYNEERDVSIEIGREQFDKIANTVNEFDDYMRKALGMSFQEKAEKERMRAKFSDSEQKTKKKKKEDTGKKSKKSRRQDESSDSSEDEEPKKKGSHRKSRRRSGSESGDPTDSDSD